MISTYILFLNCQKEGNFSLDSNNPPSSQGALRNTDILIPDEEGEWQQLVEQVGRLRHDNQTLRDTNDELLARIDQLTLHPGGGRSVGGPYTPQHQHHSIM